MDQATQFVQSNSSILTTVAFLAVLIAILYVVYSYLYPADDPSYVQMLQGEADARKPIHLKHNRVPTIYSGGDFTLSFWVYIDDWNYKASSSKFLFAISPQNLGMMSVSPLVGMLTPMQNGLMVRAATVGKYANTTPGTAPSDTATPDITREKNMQDMLKGQTSTLMFQTTLDTPCDVKEIPLQRWVCLTIVSSGRVLDVYMDGKLSRSCVLDNIVHIPRGPLVLRLGESGGFGGRYSSVQMWNQQLTPDVIYGIYQMGPTQAQHNVFTDIAKYFNLNVSFTGSAPSSGLPPSLPGQTAPASSNPFSQLYSEASSAYSSVSSDITSAYSSDTGMGQKLLARF